MREAMRSERDTTLRFTGCSTLLDVRLNWTADADACILLSSIAIIFFAISQMLFARSWSDKRKANALLAFVDCNPYRSTIHGEVRMAQITSDILAVIISECVEEEPKFYCKEDIQVNKLVNNIDKVSTEQTTSIVQKITRTLESHKLISPESKILVLWSGYEQHMLQIAMRLAKLLRVCTIEGSNLSDTFVKTYGTWQSELDNIKSKFAGKLAVLEDEDQKDKVVFACRKGMWDHISSIWAQTAEEAVCIVIVPFYTPENPVDFRKTLFAIELPIIEQLKVQKVILIRCDVAKAYIEMTVIENDDLKKLTTTVKSICRKQR